MTLGPGPKGAGGTSWWSPCGWALLDGAGDRAVSSGMALAAVGTHLPGPFLFQLVTQVQVTFPGAAPSLLTHC